MKRCLAKHLLWMVVLAGVAAEEVQLSYDPAVVALTGTLFEEAYSDDPPNEQYRGAKALLFRLEKPVSLQGVPGDLLNVEMAHVQKVALNMDEAKRAAIVKQARGEVRFTISGTLYQPGTTYFLRPVALLVGSIQLLK